MMASMGGWMRDLRFFMMVVGVIFIAVALTEAQEPSGKIHFDVSHLDENGLSAQQQAVSYEFCVPQDDNLLAEVQSIDPTVQLACGSTGRVGCQPGQCLAIGNTHQKAFRQVLQRLEGLPYVAQIQECFWE